MYERLARIFGIDPRSLGLFRIGLGGLLLLNLGVRAGDLIAHYTDAGVLPRSALYALREGPHLSLHLLSGGLWWQVVLFTVAGVAALALLVGYRARVAALVSWVLLLSLHVRNPYIINSGDAILLLLLLWSIFLPLSARWSLQPGRMEGARIERPVFSVATVGILLQVCLVYFTSVFYKTGAPWREDFSALYYALQLDAYTTVLGQALGGAPFPILQGLTIATLLLEGIGPLLVLSPFYSGPVRTFTALAFIGFHAGLVLTMTLGLFSFICIVAWVLFLPSWFWERAIGLRPITWTRQRLDNLEAGLRRRQLQPVLVVELGVVGSLIGMIFLWLSLLMSWQGIDHYVAYTFGKAWGVVEKPVEALRLRQKWGMFAPVPATADAWYGITGVHSDGSRVELFHPPESSEAGKPSLVAPRYKNQRWRKFLFEHYRAGYFEKQRHHLAAYFGERWNERHPTRPVERVEVMLFLENTLPPGEGEPTVEPKLLYPEPDEGLSHESMDRE